MKYAKLMAQISMLKKLLQEYKYLKINNNVAGMEVMLCINSYLAACYLIEWVAWEEAVNIGKRNMETYIAITKERQFFNSPDTKKLFRFETELCYFEALHECRFEYEKFNMDTVEKIIDAIDNCAIAFYSAYMTR